MKKIIFELIIVCICCMCLYSCGVVYKNYSYIQQKPERWVSLHENTLPNHYYLICDSMKFIIDKYNIIKKKKNDTLIYQYFSALKDIPEICIQWSESSRTIYTDFFLIPIFPNILFQDSIDNKNHWVSLYILSNKDRDSIEYSLQNVKFLANQKYEIKPYNVDSENYKNLKKSTKLYYNLHFNAWSDTINTLTVIFDSISINGKMKYIDTLNLNRTRIISSRFLTH